MILVNLLPPALRARVPAEQHALVHQFVGLIRAAMKRRGFTQRDLAKRARVSEPYLSKVLAGKQNISLRTIAKLALTCGFYVELEILKPQHKCDTGEWPPRRSRHKWRASHAG